MSDASSVVTYTSVYTDSEPWRYYREESPEIGSPGFIVYGYNGILMRPIAPSSPDYVLGPEHPPSPDYMPGPKHPPSPVEIPYEPFEDEEDDDEEKEHLALADSSGVPIIDHVFLAGDIEAFETDESEPKPGSPRTIIPFSQIRLCRARKTVRLEPPMTDIPEDDVPHQKRACLTTPSSRFEVGESSAAGAARQPGPTESDLRRCRVEQIGYEITDTWDEIVDTLMEIAPNTSKGVNQRVTELDTTVRQRTDEYEDRSAAIAAHVRTLEAQVPALIAQTSSLQTQLTTTLGRIEILEARDPEPQEGLAEASKVLNLEKAASRFLYYNVDFPFLSAFTCLHSYSYLHGGKRTDHPSQHIDRSAAIAAHVRTLEAQVAALIAQTSSLQTQLTTTLGRIEILEARDPEPQEGLAEASSSC
nr:hypothetical protein [Tanacetum cinerariifolium]